MTRIFKARIGHAIIVIKRPIIRLNEQLLKVLNQQKGIRIYFMEEQNKKQKEASEKGVADFKKEEMPNHYFALMKQLTLLGYFTSKEGMTKALRYNPVPGRYEGCIDYKKGDKLFAGLGG